MNELLAVSSEKVIGALRESGLSSLVNMTETLSLSAASSGNTSAFNVSAFISQCDRSRSTASSLNNFHSTLTSLHGNRTRFEGCDIAQAQRPLRCSQPLAITSWRHANQSKCKSTASRLQCPAAQHVAVDGKGWIRWTTTTSCRHSSQSLC
jgi:hypothetical protein